MEEPTVMVKFWRVQHLNNLELMHVTYLNQVFSRHMHETFAIGVVEAGIGAFTYRGARQVAPVGSIFVINPGEAHTGGGFEGWCTYRVMYPEPALLQRLASEASGKRQSIPVFSTAIIRDERLARLLRHLHVSFEGDSPKLEQESGLFRALGQMIIRYSDYSNEVAVPERASRERRAVRLAQEYLEAHYAENVSLSQLVDLTGLSGFHLTRSFCRATGLPPHAWLTQMRVLRAKNLLSQGRPIAQVALDIGFSHQSHLNRHFKRLVGTTPGQYQLGSKIMQDGKKSCP
jgi:AraC-like DNA-binding protein